MRQEIGLPTFGFASPGRPCIGQIAARRTAESVALAPPRIAEGCVLWEEQEEATLSRRGIHIWGITSENFVKILYRKCCILAPLRMRNILLNADTGYTLCISISGQFGRNTEHGTVPANRSAGRLANLYLEINRVVKHILQFLSMRFVCKRNFCRKGLVQLQVRPSLFHG
jgi:hypothetical protein